MTVVLQEQIKMLIDLQKIDSEIFYLDKELKIKPAERKRLEESFSLKQAQLRELETQLKFVQMKRKEKEGELVGKEESVKKYQAQLYQVKTNKEYSALQAEIKGIQTDNSLLEEEIIKLLEFVDDLTRRITREKEHLSEEEKKFHVELQAIDESMKMIRTKGEELKKSRQPFLTQLDKRLLGDYERILKGRGGLALAPVRNGSCGGCNMGLPPQVVNEVHLGEKLVFCESCARILYWL